MRTLVVGAIAAVAVPLLLTGWWTLLIAASVASQATGGFRHGRA